MATGYYEAVSPAALLLEAEVGLSSLGLGKSM